MLIMLSQVSSEKLRIQMKCRKKILASSELRRDYVLWKAREYIPCIFSYDCIFCPETTAEGLKEMTEKAEDDGFWLWIYGSNGNYSNLLTSYQLSVRIKVKDLI